MPPLSSKRGVATLHSRPFRSTVRAFGRLCATTAVLLTLAVFLLLRPLVKAQTPLTWTSTSDPTFSNGANWSGGTAPANDTTSNSILFDGNGTANPVLTANQSVQGVTLSGGNYTFALGTNALTVGTGGI